MADVLSQFMVSDRVAVVTGGAGAIGEAVAAALADAGAAVALWDSDVKAADAVAEKLNASGARAFAIACDITREHDITRATAKTVSTFGGLDILINNAGIALRAPSVELPLSDWERVVAVNMTGAFLCARHAAREMMPRGRGAIVNIASIMGFSGGGLYPNISYQATKGALVNMTRALAVEWASARIRVNAVAPTWVRSALIAPLLADPQLQARIEALTPMARLAEPAEVAAAVLFLASDAASMITGHTLPVDGGFLAQ